MGRAIWACGMLLAGYAGLAGAAEMTPPKVIPVSIDWDAARADAARIPALEDLAAARDAGESDGALARMNAAARGQFPGIGTSAVPVLLPFDPDTALRASPQQTEAAMLGGFRVNFFQAGPTGYDAAFTMPADLASTLSGRSRKDEVNVYISGFALLYDLPAGVNPKTTPVKDMEFAYPGIQRSWHESYVRYAFNRYGVSYVVSMLCADGPARGRWLACKDADRVIARFLDSIKFAGGAPQPPLADPVNTINRPMAQSDDFTYAPPGQILSNTGFRKLGGNSDYTVYAKMTFPMAQAPAFANSQSFLHWGNCDFTGRTSPSSRKGAPYRCKVNDKPLVFDESAAENRTYPWRDNFCEHRHFFVGQCPGGQGHQGQDIRPTTCQLRNDGADRCTAYNDDVVAVRDGIIMRTPGREAMFLIVNVPGERIRFRYLHMNPKKLDADGLVNGRKVRNGEVIGKVGNFDRIENGTTYHLHFDVQVPTALGWVFVNPYMTLVASYERLIGGRGREVGDEPVIAWPPIVEPVAVDTTEKYAPDETPMPAAIEKARSSGTAAAKNLPAPHAIDSSDDNVVRFGTDTGRDSTAP
ncbi:MAG TPA: M23 family metallopeptidase [Xanthobacteraceae bacterium]|nr:M23 family metallopeptidase [Xanthobacteraceae bacterium]